MTQIFDHMLDWLRATSLHRRLTLDRTRGIRMLSEVIAGGEYSEPSVFLSWSSADKTQRLKISDKSSTGRLLIGDDAETLALRNGYILWMNGGV